MRHPWRQTARQHGGVASRILQPPSSPARMMPKRKQTKSKQPNLNDPDKSKDKRAKKGKDGKKNSKIKKDQQKRDKKKGKKGKNKKAKSASSSRGSAGMEEAETAPGGGKGDDKGKDGDGKQASKQASKQAREARAAAKTAAKRALVATSFWSLQGAQLFCVFLDNFRQDGDVDWPHCEKFVEEVNKVPEQVLK